MVRKRKVAKKRKAAKRAYRTIALPLDVRAWVKQEARRTGASENSEIVRCIRGRMASEGRETRALERA